MNNKVETYIGFAIKKGSVVFGCDGIKSSRKRIFLLLYTSTLSENSLSVLQQVCKRTGCPLVQIEDFQILMNKNCKALAICDKSLANAILDNLM